MRKKGQSARERQVRRACEDWMKEKGQASAGSREELPPSPQVTAAWLRQLGGADEQERAKGTGITELGKQH